MTVDDAGKLTLELCQKFQDAGLPSDDAFTVLISHALAIGNDTRGPVSVGRHLFMLAMKYTADCKDEIEAGIEAQAELAAGARSH